MVFVTQQARQELKKLLAANGKRRNRHLRLIDRGNGELSIIVDAMTPEDRSLEFEGKVLLVFDPGLASELKRISLDAYDTPNGASLVITEETFEQSSARATVNWIPLTGSYFSKN